MPSNFGSGYRVWRGFREGSKKKQRQRASNHGMSNVTFRGQSSRVYVFGVGLTREDIETVFWQEEQAIKIILHYFSG